MMAITVTDKIRELLSLIDSEHHAQVLAIANELCDDDDFCDSIGFTEDFWSGVGDSTSILEELAVEQVVFPFNAA